MTTEVADVLAPDLVEVIQAIVRDELGGLRVAEVGVVTEQFSHADDGDKDNYACTVRLRDSGLELAKVPVATGRIGLAAMPNVGDLVLVQFVGGSIHGAVITGRLYNDEDRPPANKPHEAVYICPDPADSAVRRLYVELPNGNKLTVNDDKVLLETGDTKIEIKNGGDVQITSNAKVVVTSSGDTEIKSDGGITLEASQAVKVKAGTDLTLEGLSVKVKGQTTAQLEGAAGATVKGPMISLAGMTSFSPG